MTTPPTSPAEPDLLSEVEENRRKFIIEAGLSPGPFKSDMTVQERIDYDREQLVNHLFEKCYGSEWLADESAGE